MKVEFISLGCKTNQYETNAMEQKFIENGYEVLSNKEEKADIYIVNTCSVTNIAERKSRQMLRRTKQLNPHAIIVACGCYAQVAKEEINKIDEVDLILGTNEKNNIVEIVEDYIKVNNCNEINERNCNKSDCNDINEKVCSKENQIEKEKQITDKIQVTDVMHQKEYKDFGTTTYTEENRAVIKVQDGCDRFCTYCIIPYARGKVRSRNPENIIEEVSKIAEKGIKEVVLTGIHIASYGKDFDDEKVREFRKKYGYSEDYEKFDAKDDLATGGFRLIELIEVLNNLPEIERIRLGSIEPKLITEDFLKRLSKLDKVCPHFHISLQSGCDETLKRMNRRYTTSEFENICNTLRRVYLEVAITTDVIVGFPGETDEDFEKTYEFLKKIKLYKMHIFKYSPKKGTVAEKMEAQVDGNIKEARSQRLIELSNKNEEEYNKSYIGKNVKVLFEERDEKGYFKGHTANYMAVKVLTEENLENKILEVKITKAKGLETFGEVL